jgi:hypothetical protein
MVQSTARAEQRFSPNAGNLAAVCFDPFLLPLSGIHFHSNFSNFKQGGTN